MVSIPNHKFPSPSPSPSHLLLSSPQKKSHSSVRCPPFEYYSLSPPAVSASGNVLGPSSRIVGSLAPSTPAFLPLGLSPYLSAKSNRKPPLWCMSMPGMELLLSIWPFFIGQLAHVLPRTFWRRWVEGESDLPAVRTCRSPLIPPTNPLSPVPLVHRPRFGIRKILERTALGCGLRIALFAYLISSCPFKRRSCLPQTRRLPLVRVFSSSLDFPR